MATVTVDGVELFWDELGSGEPILFHHGWTGSHDTYLELIAPLLADRYRCIVMDARGCGDSAHPDDGYNIAQYADDVIALADAIGLDRFTFVGHSMGGGIGFQLGLTQAPRLDRLVLEASIPAAGIAGMDEDFAEMRERRLVPDAREQLLAERKLMRLRVPEARLERGVDRGLSVSQRHYDDSWESMKQFDVSDRLDKLTTPTLVIAGAADSLCADNVQDWLRLPNAALHVFSRVGHGVSSDVPEQYAEVIADFMEHGVVNAQTQADKLEAARAG
ncbi:MAG: alpha/beta hydrolase [Gammaproteobacteria bacterium]|nr:alpha/beta hydrolase [Gammaproteobacteria bacterium]